MTTPAPTPHIVAAGPVVVIPAPKSTEEIEQLKRSWKHDPCWDIETTEGFEAHHEELIAFRIQMEIHWKETENYRVNAKAKSMGCSPELVRWIEYLQLRIHELETKGE
jgi:hypothetical protein